MKAKKNVSRPALMVAAALVWIAAFVLGAWLIRATGLQQHVHQVSDSLVIALVVLLPLVGAPAAIMFALAGAKFGPVLGMTVTSGAIAIQLIASWWIAHSWLRRPLDALFRRAGYHKPQVPDTEYVPFCLLISLLPGLSYAMKNYSLALGGVPFRYFFWVCLPANVLHASLGVLFGDFLGHLTAAHITFLVIYGAVLFGFGQRIVKRLRARRGLRHALPIEVNQDET